jgi:hypothetical protein
MRLSTSNNTSSTSTTMIPHILHLYPTNPHQSISNIKKVFSTLISKLPSPHTTKIVPSQTLVKNNDRTMIKVVVKNTNKPVIITAIKKDVEMNRDVRNYYNRKRQATDSMIALSNNSNKRLDSAAATTQKELQKEREMRHKTVKQYQQTNLLCHHWKQEDSIHTNKYAPPQKPKWLNTHGYVRGELRSNSNYLRVAILTQGGNPSAAASAAAAAKNMNKPFLRKRRDEFVWGSPSPLSSSISM